MIFDNINNLSRYENLGEIYEALTAIKNNNADSLDLSKNIKIMTNRLKTENSSKKLFENHRENIDIHYCIEGTEQIELVFDFDKLKVSGDYNSENDIEFYENRKEDLVVTLQEGDFLVIYPNQIHKPLCSVDDDIEIKKHIVKIKIK